MTDFDSVIERVRAHEDSIVDAPVTRERIADVEAELGATFPAELVAFHVTIGSGEFPFGRLFSLALDPRPPQPYDVSLIRSGARPASGRVVLVEQGSCEVAEAWHALYDVAGCEHAGLVPFADDWGGNVYCFDKAGRILFVDHEAREPEPELVAASFAVFVEDALGGGIVES